MAELAIDHISKRFGERLAADDVSITVEDGEFVVVFGAPSAGKSTLLKLIAGIEQPTSGTVSIGGRDVTALPSQRRNVSMAFESYALYPHLSVRGNLEFPLRAPGRDVSATDRDAAVRKVAELLEIDHLLDRRPRQLSGGQRQRVSLGRALVRTVDVTLLDEPIAHLDARLRSSLRAELRHFQRERQATTVYCTPDYVEAFGVADRIAVLVEGSIHQFDTPRHIFDAPASVAVAALVGDPKINLVPVQDGAVATSLGTHPVGAIPADKTTVRTLGLRPADLQLVHETDDSIPGTVYVSQPVGVEEIVKVDLGGLIVTVRRPLADRARIGAPAHLRVPWDRALCFGADGRLLDSGVA